jgi:hypothetical protein
MSNSTMAMRVIRAISQSLCIVLLLTCGALSAQSQEHHVRNIVLVHGAWADGSGWKGVYDILVKDGYNVSIVQEPETSFKEDVAATKRVLAQQNGPCILVAHSYGEPSLQKQEQIHWSPVWYTSQPTCQMPERMRPTTESASQATSANLAR